MPSLVNFDDVIERQSLKTDLIILQSKERCSQCSKKILNIYMRIDPVIFEGTPKLITAEHKTFHYGFIHMQLPSVNGT